MGRRKQSATCSLKVVGGLAAGFAVAQIWVRQQSVTVLGVGDTVGQFLRQSISVGVLEKLSGISTTPGVSAIGQPSVAEVAPQRTVAKPSTPSSAVVTTSTQPVRSSSISRTTPKAPFGSVPTTTSKARAIIKKAHTPDSPNFEWYRGSDVQIDPAPERYRRGAPRIFGLDRCARFREQVPQPNRLWGVAGLQDSGTNALFFNLMENCALMKNPIVGWQTPWGKHNWLFRRAQMLNNTLPVEQIPRTWNKRRNVTESLPVMIVKDPYMWMASTCRHSYLSFRRPKPPENCPFPLSKTAGKADHVTFTSLVDLWSRWNREYLDADFPVLVVRYEDLLWYPEQLVTAVCECVGGTPKRGENFKVLQTAAKWGAGHGDNGHNRTSRLQKYMQEVQDMRSRFNRSDMEFLRQNIDQGLLEYFGYSLDP